MSSLFFATIVVGLILNVVHAQDDCSRPPSEALKAICRKLRDYDENSRVSLELFTDLIFPHKVPLY